MHSPLAMQDLAHFSDSAAPLPNRRMSSTPETTAFGSAPPRPAGAGDRTGREAGAAFGAGVEHVVDAAGQGFFESGVVHGKPKGLWSNRHSKRTSDRRGWYHPAETRRSNKTLVHG